MNILWHSVAPWCPTGYGQQTATFVPRFRDAGHEVAISARFGLEGGKAQWDGITVLPRDEALGDAILALYAKGWDDCQVISLFDVWPMRVATEALRTLDKFAAWTPVDHDPAPPAVVEFFKGTGARTIAMSRFGEGALQDKGLDPLYVPHGIDTKTFAPFDKAEARKFFGIPDGAFLVGMVAQNSGNAPPRKAFPQVIEAFSIFQKRHPDAILWLHCEVTGSLSPMKPGVDLPAVAMQMGIPSTAVACTPALQELATGGIAPAQLAALYSAMDVLVNPSYGEGFGIPIVEAQACGTPVIVSDWTSMPELCGAGWKVGGERWYNANQHSFFLSPSVEGIVAALEDSYEHAAGMRDHAREFALQFDAGRVMAEHWTPVLEALGKPREVAPLNRAMRRRAKKVAA